MAQYCVVAPPQILKVLSDFDHMPVAHLLLAHDIVKPEKQNLYKELFNGEYFLELHKNDFGKYPPRYELKILDNSVVELGHAVELDMIRAAAEIVRPTCIVLPDAYLDTDLTISQCRAAIGPWSKGLKDLFDYRGVPFMYLPQGRTKADFQRAAEAFATDSRITWWGIPRNVVEYQGSRQWAIELCNALNPHRNIHMFGFSEDLVDDVRCATRPFPHIRSIDSAVPARCNYHKLEFSLHVKMPKRGDWWEKGEYATQVRLDIEQANSLFAGKGMR